MRGEVRRGAEGRREGRGGGQSRGGERKAE